MLDVVSRTNQSITGAAHTRAGRRRLCANFGRCPQMMKQLSLKKAALSLAAAAALGASAQISAQGLDSAESKLYPNYVTDDMLLNADKDSQNWLLYGKDYQSTRYSVLKQINKDNVKKLRP